VHATTIFDLLTARENAANAARDALREQITKLTDELSAVDAELADLATTRQTLLTLVGHESTSTDATIVSEPYQRILAVFASGTSGMRAKDVCRELGTGIEPKDTEGIRAKLKRLVNRHVLTETEPGLFTLTPKQT
jgi:hypothetical protein